MQTILEFGCGVRGFIDLYAREAQVAYALDIHDYSKFYPTRIRFLLSDGVKIPLADRHVDLVVSHSVVEHIDDLATSLSEINRVTKPGGLIYITVSPLYYSPTGSHVRSLPAWEHVNPESRHFMMRSPLQDAVAGSYLNQRKFSEFAALFSEQAWSFLRFERKLVGDTVPNFAARLPVSKLDLLTKEFRMIAVKLGHPELT